MRTPGLALVSLIACGGSTSSTPPPAAPSQPPPSTPAPVASSSACDRAPDGTGPGMRRLEIKVNAAPGTAEVMVDGLRRVSAREGTSACGYAALTPGAHEVTLIARGEPRLGAQLEMQLENAKGPWWYDVFALDCGVTGACTKDNLVAWRKRVEGDRKSLTDPCSAAQVRKLTWESEKAPGSDQFSLLKLTFTVFLYQEAFDKEPRDESCPEN